MRRHTRCAVVPGVQTALPICRLLAAGARLDIRYRSGKTPLHQAALVNDPVLVLKCLKAGADRRAIDRLGASLQDYLYRSNPKLLNAPAQRRLMAVGGWLQAHGIADAPTIEGVFPVAAPESIASRHPATGVALPNCARPAARRARSEEHTFEIQSLLRTSYADFFL